MMTSIAGAGGGTVLLAAMLQFMNPSEAIPVHGEALHINQHAKIASEKGVSRE